MTMIDRPKFRRKNRPVQDPPPEQEEDLRPIAPLETRDQRLARRQSEQEAEDEQRRAEAQAAADAARRAREEAEAARVEALEKAAREAAAAEAARQQQEEKRRQQEAERKRRDIEKRRLEEQERLAAEQEARARAEAEARVLAEETARKKAEARANAEALAKAEAQAKAEALAKAEAQRQAEEKRRAEEAKRKAEKDRLAQEAARKAEADRKAEELRKAEEAKRQAQRAARLEAERLEAEALEIARAEAERARQEALRKQQAEAEAKAARQRAAEDEARKREEARQRAAQVEEDRRARAEAEAARKAEAQARRAADEEALRIEEEGRRAARDRRAAVQKAVPLTLTDPALPGPVRPRRPAAIPRTAPEAAPEIAPQTAPESAVAPVRPSAPKAPPVQLGPKAAWAALREFPVDEAHLTRNRIVTASRDDPAHTAFDVLRTRLLQALNEHGWKRVAITSPTKDCGKTFTAANLAISLSRQENCRTLLIDCDMRRPSLHKVMGVKAPGPVGDMLRGRVAPQDHLMRLGENSIHAGHNIAFGFNSVIEPYASELLQDPRTTDTLRSIEDQFAPDVVLFDLPPALFYDDVIALRPQFDGVLLVVGGGITTEKEIKEVERRLGETTPLLGMVLNKAEGTELSRYSY